MARPLAPRATNPRVRTSPIFRWRRRYNQTRRHLALRSGVSVRRIYEYESGRVLPRPETLARLAGVLGASAWRLSADVVGHHCGIAAACVAADGRLTPEFYDLGDSATEYVVKTVTVAATDRRAFMRFMGPVLRELTED